MVTDPRLGVTERLLVGAWLQAAPRDREAA